MENLVTENMVIQGGAVIIAILLIFLLRDFLNGKFVKNNNKIVSEKLLKEIHEALEINSKLISTNRESQFEMAKALQKLSDNIERLEETVSRKLRAQ